MKDVRDTAVRVQLTGALVEQLKTLKSEIDRILTEALAVQEEKTEEVVELEEKSLSDAIEGVVASDVDVKVVEDLDRQVKAFESAIENDDESIKEQAISVLDLISEALSGVQNVNDEKSLKILAASVGTALRTYEEKSDAEEVVAEEISRKTLSLAEFEDLKNFSI